MSEASTREDAYLRLARELGVSVGSIKNAASKAGLTSSPHNMRFTFSEKEEEALTCACLIYAREGAPLTTHEFLKLANRFAKRKTNAPRLSYHFAYDFVERHSTILSLSSAIITSPTRWLDAMLEKTKEFIATIESHLVANKLNVKNMVVFDETIVADPEKPPKVIGERKDCGGGSVNVNSVREFALGSFIPFSTAEGYTPFRVFIFREKFFAKAMEFFTALAPTEEKGLRDTPHRLFLCSETGYVTIELFQIIMEEFTKWWNEYQPGLECFLISDNLRIHNNTDIVAMAKDKGIHMINIMPGSSHWFQVHDQLPFGHLKKRMIELKNEILSGVKLTKQQRRMALMSIFYQAEKEAFAHHMLLSSFANVGMWPWNPKKILDNCRKYCPVRPEPKSDDMVHRLAKEIHDMSEEKKEGVRQLLLKVKEVEVKIPENLRKRKRPDEKLPSRETEEEIEGADSSIVQSKSVSTESPAKKVRRMQASPIKCGVRGCENSHFWSKKWFFCQVCKKNFCPQHEKAFKHHVCSHVSY